MSNYSYTNNLDLDGENDVQEILNDTVRLSDVNQTVLGTKTFANVVIHDLSVNSQTTFATEDGIIHQLKDNTVNDLLDYGNYGTYNNGSGVRYKGLINKAGTDKFYAFHNQLNEPATSLNLGTQNLGSIVVREPTASNEVATKNYVETHAGGNFLPLTGGTLTGNLDMGTNDIIKIYRLKFSDTSPLNYNYLSFPDTNKLTIESIAPAGTLTNTYMHFNDTGGNSLIEVMQDADIHGDLNFKNNKRILGLQTPSQNDEASTKGYADTKLALSGGTMTGNITLPLNRQLILGNNRLQTIGNNDIVFYKGTGADKFFALNDNELYTSLNLNMNGNSIINVEDAIDNGDAINKGQVDTALNLKLDKSTGSQTITATDDIQTTWDDVNVNSFLFHTPNSETCKLALKSKVSGFNSYDGRTMIEFQTNMSSQSTDVPSGRIISRPDIPEFVFERAFMDFYNSWDFNPGGNDGQLLHMMRFSDIIRMYRQMDMSGNQIKNIANGTVAGDAVNKSQLDTKLNLSGGTMSGILNMATNKIVNVGTPTAGSDVATKDYVDANAGQVVRYVNFTENGFNPAGTGRTFVATLPTTIPDGDYYFDFEIYLKYQDNNTNADGFKFIAFPEYSVAPTHEVATVFDMKNVVISTANNVYGSATLKWFDTRTSLTNNSTVRIALNFNGGGALNFDVDIRGKVTKV